MLRVYCVNALVLFWAILFSNVGFLWKVLSARILFCRAAEQAMFHHVTGGLEKWPLVLGIVLSAADIIVCSICHRRSSIGVCWMLVFSNRVSSVNSVHLACEGLKLGIGDRRVGGCFHETFTG